MALSPVAPSPAGWMICAPVGSILAEERLPTTMLILGLPADGYLTLNAVEATWLPYFRWKLN